MADATFGCGHSAALMLLCRCWISHVLDDEQALTFEEHVKVREAAEDGKVQASISQRNGKLRRKSSIPDVPVNDQPNFWTFCTGVHSIQLQHNTMSTPRYRSLLQLVRNRTPWRCVDRPQPSKAWTIQSRRALQTSQKSAASRGGAAPTMEQMRAPFKQSNASTLYASTQGHPSSRSLTETNNAAFNAYTYNETVTIPCPSSSERSP